jgi:2-keto-4-pentenoate hydratase/2-oxohepta-3-ene-1,7-dioic acid hydratase in catechol pathway
MTRSLANVAGRAVLSFGADGSVDVGRASGGRFGPTPADVLEDWAAFRSWSESIGPDAPPLIASQLGPPVPAPRQVFAIGLNYRLHAEEAGHDTKGLPQVFTKFPSCLAGPIATVPIVSPRLDWEVELVVVIGETCQRVNEGRAWDRVAGLMVGQDLSARDVQLAGQAAQWSLGKSFTNFGPTGPFLVPTEMVAHPDDLRITCRLNDEVVQDSRTSQMIWGVAELVARLSSVVTLFPGDLIFTGTPAGVGNRREPPRYLGVDDVLVSEIEGLGELTTTFAKEAS